MSNGVDIRAPVNTAYAIMLKQVMRDFHGIGDFRLLKAHEIKFLYNDCREELKAIARANSGDE